MHKIIKRKLLLTLTRWLKQFAAVAILGPRQCGKSTLAKMLAYPYAIYLDLERPSDLNKLRDPELFFSLHKDNLICLDEIQRLPEIFPVLRSAIDANEGRSGQFLILGSASRELIRQSSESLAGRIGYLELTPFLVSEVLSSPECSATSPLLQLWLRGGFPRSFLAKTDQESLNWREQFIRTFLERDIPQLGINIPSALLQRFWMMCAHYHGQLLNQSKLGEALGVSHTTIRSYLELLRRTFVIRMLPPFEANLKKRLVKSPKIYLRDSGLLHGLLSLASMDDLLGHPVIGSSWEGLVIENILSHLDQTWQAGFYRTASGDEIDLIVAKKNRKIAIECKASSAPAITDGFYRAREDLNIDQAFVVAPVKDSYSLKPGVEVIGLLEIIQRLS